MNKTLDAVTVFQVEQVGRSRSGMSRRVRIFGLTPTRIIDATELVATHNRMRYSPVTKSLSVSGTGFSLVEHLNWYIEQTAGRPVKVERI